MRLFIAINLSDAMKKALSAAQDEMYGKGVRGNFTPRENMHLTLAFIGEYPDKEQVMDALSSVSFSAFTLSLSGMGCFRDLWLPWYAASAMRWPDTIFRLTGNVFHRTSR